jgi:hypothetical protein
MKATSPAADPESATINSSGPATESGGLKAIWHLEILTGKEAQALLEMQNQAIIRLLTWAEGYEKSAGQDNAGGQEIGVNVSRETLGLAA